MNYGTFFKDYINGYVNSIRYDGIAVTFGKESKLIMLQ